MKPKQPRPPAASLPPCDLLITTKGNTAVITAKLSTQSLQPRYLLSHYSHIIFSVITANLSPKQLQESYFLRNYGKVILSVIIVKSTPFSLQPSIFSVVTTNLSHQSLHPSYLHSHYSQVTTSANNSHFISSVTKAKLFPQSSWVGN